MKLRPAYALCAVAGAAALVPQVPLVVDPYPTKPKLQFKDDGTFKLTVFSDLHFGENPWEDWGLEQDRKSLLLINRVLPDERPNFVVINGDLITGENTFKENSTLLIDQIVGPLKDAGIPFCSSYGNHDNQVNITHAAEMAREQEIAPLSYTRASPPGVGGDSEEAGVGNYWVPIYYKDGDASPVLLLWVFDSRGGVSPGENSSRLPDWVDPSVAKWVASELELLQTQWDVSSIKHLAFVHIPPFAVQALQLNVTKDVPGLNDDQLGGDGSTQSTYPPLTSCGNSCDEPFWDSLKQNFGPNLIAVVSGHNHGNEWCATEKKKELIFCFNKHTGYGGYDRDGWDHGVRNFVFSKSPGSELAVESWIRYEMGETKARVRLRGTQIEVVQA